MSNMPTIKKIGKYAANLSKSIAISTVKAIPSKAPNMRSFVEETSSISKDIYASVSGFRNKIKKSDMKESNSTVKSIHKTLQVAGEAFAKAVKTGNLYADVSDKYQKEISGIDMDEGFDFNFDDDFNFDSDSDSDFSLEDLSSDLGSTISAAAVSQNSSIAEGTNLIIESNKANAAISAAYMEKMTTAITSSIAAVYNKTESINEFLNNNMVTHINNSAEYYKNSIILMTQQRDMMKDMLDIQKNYYGVDNRKGSTTSTSDYMKVLGYGGFNVKEYANILKKRVREKTDMATSLFGMFGGGGGMGGEGGMNPLLGMAASLPGFIMDSIGSLFIPKNVKKSMGKLDNTFGSIVSNLFSRINRRAKTFSGGMLDGLFELLGLGTNKKTSINTGKFEKGPIPFDGITKQAIVEVIPGYLARIEAALTGGEERHYDMVYGKWMNISSIKSNFDAIWNRRMRDMFSDFDSELGYLYKREDGKKYRSSAKKIKKKVVDDEGYFNPGLVFDKNGKVVGAKNADYYGVDEATFLELAKHLSRSTIMNLASKVAKGKDDYGKELEREEKGNGIMRQLHNGAYSEDYFKKSKNGHILAGGNGPIFFSKDEEGHNLFDYLRDILTIISGNHKDNLITSKAGSIAKSGLNTYREFKSAGNKSGDSSEGESDDDDDSDVFYGDRISEEEIEEIERKKNEERRKEKRKEREKWIKEKFGDNKVVKAIATIATNTQSILEKPGEFISGMIDNADTALFKIMFGDHKTFIDIDGKESTGVLNYITDQVNRAFDKVHKFVEDHIFGPIRKGLSWLWEKFGSKAFEGAKNAGKTIFDLFRGDVKSAEDIENDAEGINTSAGGRIVTKRGLTMISPGEIIIPASFDKKEQARMLALEKRDRSKIAKTIGLNASGTINLDDLTKFKDKIFNSNKVKNTKDTINNFVDSRQNEIRGIGGGGIIGGGLGLLAGMNPILGAVIGSAIGFVKNNKAANEMLFGKDMLDEEGNLIHKDGMIPKPVQDYFKKNAKDMGRFSIVGGLLGLFTPFGLLGGAAMGAATSMVKNSDAFQKFVFGDPDDPNSNSLMKALDDSIIEPAKKKMEEFQNAFKDYTKKNVLDPLKNFWDPFKQTITNAIHDTANGFRDFMKDSFEKVVGLPMADFLREKFFKPFGSFFGKAIKAPGKLLGGIATLPFRTLGGIGNLMQMRNINRGKAYNLTSQERLNFRNKHAFLSDFSFWTGKDRSYEQDEVFANMTEDELMQLAAGAKSGIYSEEQLQEQLGQAKANLTKTISNSNLYATIGYDNAAKLNKLLQTGDYDKINKFINKIENENPGAGLQLRNLVKNDFDAIKGAQIALNDSRQDQGQINNKLRQLLGRDVKDKKDRRNIYELAEAEIRNRNKATESANTQKLAVFDPKAAPEDPVSATNLNTRVIETQGDKLHSAINRVTDTLTTFKTQILSILDPKTVAEESAGGEPATSDGALLLSAPTENGEVEIISSEKRRDKKGRRESKNKNRAIREAEREARKERDRQRFRTSYDSKESTHARTEEAKERKEEEQEKEEQSETRSAFKELIDKLLGKKKDRKKKGGVLDKIHDVMTGGAKFFGFAGGKVGTALKIAAGFSLFGYASEWIKTSVMPKISGILFGKQNEDGSETQGLFGKLKDSLLSGENSLLGRLFGWFGQKFTDAKNWFESAGGFQGILSNILNKALTGMALGVENIITPLVALLIKNLPSILLGVVKGVGVGLKMAFTNETYSRSVSIDSGESTKEIQAFHDKASNSLANSGGGKNPFTDAFKRIGINAAGNAAYTKSKAIDVASELAPIFEKKSKKNERKQFSLGGLLGRTQRTNEVEYDEEGNIITEYAKHAESDSVASGILGVFGKSLTNSFAGIKGGSRIANVLTKLKGKGVGSGLTKIVTGATSKIGQVTGKAMNLGSSIGSKAAGLSKRVAAGSIESASKATSKGGVGVLTKGMTKIFEFIGKSKIGAQICKMASKATSKEVTQAVMEKTLKALGEKLGSKIGAKLAGKALTKVAGAVAKFSPLGIAILIKDFVVGMDQAETILGVAKGTYNVPVWLKVVCGLVNLLTETFTFGLVPSSLIMDIAIEFICPLFGADVSELNKARSAETVNAALDEWNKEHPEDTYDNLEDFNNKDKWWFKAGKSIKGFFGGVGEKISSGFNAVKEKVGAGVSLLKDAKDELVKDPAAAIKQVISIVIGGAKDLLKNAYSSKNPIDALKYKPEFPEDSESGPIGKIGMGIFNIMKTFMSPLLLVTSVVGTVTRTIHGIIDGIKNIDSKINKAKKEMFDAAFDGDFDGVKNAKVKEDDGEGAGFVNDIANFAFGVQKVIMSVPAYLIAGVNAIKNKFLSQFDGYTKSQNGMKQDEQKIEDAKAGKISLFSSQYWKNASHDGEGIFGVVAHIQTYINKITSIPEILIKSLTEKIKGAVPNWVKDAWNFITGKADDEIAKTGSTSHTTSSGETDGGRSGGFGHAYQRHPSIAGMRYGNSNIANAGCAPVAATNLINSMGGNMSVAQAARFAERNGKVNSSGTDISYFNSIMSANGISNSRTSNGTSVTSALRRGNQVVILGQDSSNAPGAAFGTRPHFITATGMDNRGNIIVEDPDSPARKLVYGKDRVINSMISSVIGKRRGKGRGFGTEETASTASNVTGLLDAFSGLTKNILGKMYGNNALATLFGEGEVDPTQIVKSNTTSSGFVDGRTARGFTDSSKSSNITGNVEWSDTAKQNMKKIWNSLKAHGYSDAGIAGIIGYMAQESSLLPYIVETSQLKSLGYPFSSRSGALEQAKAFSRDVNSGKISKDTFVNTYFGYGLPQFTYGTWKKELYENTVEKGKDISSIDNQLDYLVGSWKQYVPALHKRLKSATDPQAAAIDVLHSYGMPNWESVKSYLYDNERMNYAQSAYNEFSGSGRMPTNLSYVTTGGARATHNNYGAHSYQSGSGTGIDYTTFLTTIVEVLMSIAGNTAILTKILEILSNNFNINIDKGDIEQAATQSREKAKAALNQLVTRSANNNTNISSLLGNKDTDYLLKVMSAISAE